MRLKPQSMRLTDDGVLVEGSRGSVLLGQGAKRIEASYRGRRLKDREGYIQKLQDTALETARNYPLPWSTKADGTIRIDNHKAFYEQTFDPTLQCLETLKRWLQQNSTQ